MQIRGLLDDAFQYLCVEGERAIACTSSTFMPSPKSHANRDTALFPVIIPSLLGQRLGGQSKSSAKTAIPPRDPVSRLVDVFRHFFGGPYTNDQSASTSDDYGPTRPGRNYA